MALEDLMPSGSDAKLIIELTSNPIYLHSFYDYSGLGFNPKGQSGDISFYPYLEQSKDSISFLHNDAAKKITEDLEKRYAARRGQFWVYQVWPNITNNAPADFEARIFGWNLSNGDYMFQMWYQKSGAQKNTMVCPHRYLLFLPKDKKAEIVPNIQKKPELLIDVFEALFGKSDNSKGILKIDPVFTPQIEGVLEAN